jgi:hypothetical protein
LDQKIVFPLLHLFLLAFLMVAPERILDKQTQRLTVCVTHNETVRRFLDSPRRREAAGGHRLQSSSRPSDF